MTLDDLEAWPQDELDVTLGDVSHFSTKKTNNISSKVSVGVVLRFLCLFFTILSTRTLMKEANWWLNQFQVEIVHSSINLLRDDIRPGVTGGAKALLGLIWVPKLVFFYQDSPELQKYGLNQGLSTYELQVFLVGRFEILLAYD